MSQYYPGKYPANFTRIPDGAMRIRHIPIVHKQYFKKETLTML